MCSCNVASSVYWKPGQVERDGSGVRNDRIVTVWELSHLYKTIEGIEDVDPDTLKEMESFFKQYNTLAGKEFQPIGWKDADEAMKMIRSQIV